MSDLDVELWVLFECLAADEDLNVLLLVEYRLDWQDRLSVIISEKSQHEDFIELVGDLNKFHFDFGPACFVRFSVTLLVTAT